MPRESQTSLTQRGVLDPISKPQSAQVVARPTDQLEVPAVNPEFSGLIKGLSSLNPELTRYARIASMVDADTHTRAGAAARQKGEALPDDAHSDFVHGYMMMDGQVKGNLDGEAVAQAYQTGFDKDTGNLDQFIQQQFQGMTKGVTNKSFLEGYNQTIIKHLQSVRESQNEYQQNAVVQKVESNAMVKLDNYMRPFAENGEVIPEDGINQIRGELKSYFKVSGTRFNDLLFSSMKRLGDQGNYTVYDALKRPNADGTPGMYFIPAWKEKIDAAQGHSQNVAISRANAADTAAKKLREDKQDTALYDVFAMMDSDPVGAQTRYNQLKQEGLFSRASDMISWDTKFSTALKREATPGQAMAELDLQKGVYTGSVRPQDIMNSDITPQQKRSLMGEWYRVKNDARQAAAAGNRAEDSIFKTQHFNESEAYIKSMLRPETSALDPMGIGNEFQRGQLATALRDLNDSARTVKNPSELRAISHRIVTDYQTRAKDPKFKKEIEGAGRIRYNSPAEIKDARMRGLINDEELDTHLRYYEATLKDKQLNASR